MLKLPSLWSQVTASCISMPVPIWTLSSFATPTSRILMKVKPTQTYSTWVLPFSSLRYDVKVNFKHHNTYYIAVLPWEKQSTYVTWLSLSRDLSFSNFPAFSGARFCSLDLFQFNSPSMSHDFRYLWSFVHGFVHLTLFQFNSPSHLLDKHVTGSEAIDLTCMGITVIQQCNHSCLLHQLLSVRHISTFLCVSCSLWLI